MLCLIRCLCLASVLAVCSCQSVRRQAAPESDSVLPRGSLNLVVVTIDTLRPDRLGCYGNSQVETPNLDKFAQSGVLFENAVTHTPLTAPSHASLFTGMYPTIHKVRDTGGFVLEAK